MAAPDEKGKVESFSHPRAAVYRGRRRKCGWLRCSMVQRDFHTWESPMSGRWKRTHSCWIYFFRFANSLACLTCLHPHPLPPLAPPRPWRRLLHLHRLLLLLPRPPPRRSCPAARRRRGRRRRRRATTGRRRRQRRRRRPTGERPWQRLLFLLLAVAGRQRGRRRRRRRRRDCGGGGANMGGRVCDDAAGGEGRREIVHLTTDFSLFLST